MRRRKSVIGMRKIWGAAALALAIALLPGGTEKIQAANAGVIEEGLSAEEDSVIDSGYLDYYKEISYKLYESGLLEVTGTCEETTHIYDFADKLYIWDYVYDGAGDIVYDENGDAKKIVMKDYRDKVKKVRIAITGAESVSPGFNDFPNLTEIDVSDFDTSKVTNFSYLFYGAAGVSVIDVSGFQTKNVTDMSNMFYGCKALKSVDMSGFNLSSVTDMSGMFSKCESLASINLKGCAAPNVTNLRSMFEGCASLQTLDLTGFSTPAAEDMGTMFADMKNLKTLNLGDLDARQAENMSYMFSGCESLVNLNVKSLHTGSAVKMNEMFMNCKSLQSLDLSTLETENVEEMSYMFSGCSGLKNLNLYKLQTKNVKKMDYMFEDCSSLSSLDITWLDTSGVEDLSSMFKGCSSLQSIDLSQMDTSSCQSFSGMFYDCQSLTELDCSGFVFTGLNNIADPDYRESAINSVGYLFSDLEGAKRIKAPANLPKEADLPYVSGYVWFDEGANIVETAAAGKAVTEYTRVKGNRYDGFAKTGKSGSLFWMITNEGVLQVVGKGDYALDGTLSGTAVPKWCESYDSIKKITTDVEGLTSAKNMFYGCSKISSLDLSGMDMNAITDGTGMITKCSTLTTIILPANCKVSIVFPPADGYYWVDQNNIRCTAGYKGLATSMKYSRYKEQVKQEQQTAKGGSLSTGQKIADPKTSGNYKVTGEGTVIYMGNANRKKKSITVPDVIEYNDVKYRVTQVASGAFKNNKTVTTIKIANGITEIGNGAFSGCTKLKSVTIGKDVKTIGSKAFYGDKNLKTITFKGTALKKVGGKALKGIHKKCKIKCPKSVLSSYKKKLKGKGQKKSVKIVKA